MKKKIIISLGAIFVLALSSFVLFIVKQSEMYLNADYDMWINGPKLVCHGYECSLKADCRLEDELGGCVYKKYCIGVLRLEYPE